MTGVLHKDALSVKNPQSNAIAILADSLLEFLIVQHDPSVNIHGRETDSNSAIHSQKALDIVEKPSVHRSVRNRKRSKKEHENEGG